MISDISSVSTGSYDSMPPLIDRFGRIVVDDRSTVTQEDAIRMEEPVNTHLYFDEEGNQINYAEYLRIYHDMGPEDDMAPPMEDDSEDDEELWIRTPKINQAFILKHPRVMLAFLRFIDFYNELADPEEVFMMKAIPQALVNRIQNHSSVTDVPPEFQQDVEELKHRLSRHADLSELHWG